MYLSYMIQDKVDFKSKWVPVTGAGRGLGQVPVIQGMRFSRVFIEIGSNLHTCII